MKKLKDIVLKKGDIVVYNNGTYKNSKFVVDGFDNCKATELKGTIIKIERPVKYETIYEAPKQILDKEEKEYLEAVIRPFKDRVKYITKLTNWQYEYIKITLDNDYCILPYFEKGTMYKGMETNEEYILKELGLFE